MIVFRFLALSLFSLIALVSCAHVDANYPTEKVKESWVGEITVIGYLDKGTKLIIGDRLDLDDQRAKVSDVKEQIAGASGQAAAEEQYRSAANPDALNVLLLEDSKHQFYKASLVFSDTDDWVFKEGALILEVDIDGDSHIERDNGLVFPRKGEITTYYDTADGPVIFGAKSNQTTIGQEKGLYIRIVSEGRIVGVKVDSTRAMRRE